MQQVFKKFVDDATRPMCGGKIRQWIARIIIFLMFLFIPIFIFILSICLPLWIRSFGV